MYQFNAKDACEKTCQWIQDWFSKNGQGCKAVLGVSGGKDSSIVAGLLVKSLGKDSVVGVIMPNGEQRDMNMAELLINHLGIKSYFVNIRAAYDGILREIKEAGIEISSDSLINLPPRLRMSTLYAVSQSLGGRVINTCNLSEDYVGYSTRYGDSVGDMSPVSCFTTAEIRAIGYELGLPAALIEKVPDDGLSGKTDEDKLGFTYEVLDRYIRTGEIEDLATKARIDSLHEKNLFKLRYMDCFKYEV